MVSYPPWLVNRLGEGTLGVERLPRKGLSLLSDEEWVSICQGTVSRGRWEPGPRAAIGTTRSSEGGFIANGPERRPRGRLMLFGFSSAQATPSGRGRILQGADLSDLCRRLGLYCVTARGSRRSTKRRIRLRSLISERLWTRTGGRSRERTPRRFSRHSRIRAVGRVRSPHHGKARQGKSQAGPVHVWPLCEGRAGAAAPSRPTTGRPPDAP